MRIVGVEVCAKATFSDLDIHRAIDIVKKMPRQSAISFAGKLTYPAYKYVPTSYILCENDLLVPVEKQKEYIERLKNESKTDVNVHPIQSDHCPLVGKVDELAQIITNIAAAS